MITVDTSALLKDLEKLHKDVVRRLENVVSGFAYEFILILGSNTPIGDEEAIQRVGRYRSAYKLRMERMGIDMHAGYHQGSWQFSLDTNLGFSPLITDVQSSANDGRNFAQSSYRLGEPFYIGANTPGMEALEFGYSPQAPDGISDISIQQMMQTYQIDVLKYYKE